MLAFEKPKISKADGKRLDRVFRRLGNYAEKAKVNKTLRPKHDRMKRINDYCKRPDKYKLRDHNGREMTLDMANRERERLRREINVCEDKLHQLGQTSRDFLTAADLYAAHRELGVKKSMSEIEMMIWEVDEKLDKVVDWEEFVLTYHRNINDTSWPSKLEPFHLFNLIQFMMYDEDDSGSVSIDETMTMLYTRHGKGELESQLENLFGKDLRTEDGDGELSFKEYLKVVNINIPVGLGGQGVPNPKALPNAKKKKGPAGH